MRRYHAADIMLHPIGQGQVRDFQCEIVHGQLFKNLLCDPDRRGFAFHCHHRFSLSGVNHDITSLRKMVIGQ